MSEFKAAASSAANDASLISHLRWGIIGCGDVVEQKSNPIAFFRAGAHAEDTEGALSKVVAVMRRDGSKAQDFAKRHGVDRWYCSIDELLADQEINAVYVATPPSSHKDICIRALQAGKAVYCEKPLALTAKQSAEIEAHVTGRSLFTVAHYRRALPMFVRIKELLDKKKIGDVRMVHIRCWQAKQTSNTAGLITTTASSDWRLDPLVSGGGYFHDLAPHQLDLMLYFFGDVIDCKGTALKQAASAGPSDNVQGFASFLSGSGKPVLFSGSWCFTVGDGCDIDECIIVGSAGSIKFNFFGGVGTLAVRAAGEEYWEEQFHHPAHIQEPMISRTIDYFLTPRNSKGSLDDDGNPCSLKDALAVIQIIDSFTSDTCI